jgi:hypothetical protein
MQGNANRLSLTHNLLDVYTPDQNPRIRHGQGLTFAPTFLTKGQIKMPSTALLDGARAVLMHALEPSGTFVENPRRDGMYLQHKVRPFVPQPYSLRPKIKRSLAHATFYTEFSFYSCRYYKATRTVVTIKVLVWSLSLSQLQAVICSSP